MKCILVDVWGQREDKERGGVYCCWDTIYKLEGGEVMREKVGRITTMGRICEECEGWKKVGKFPPSYFLNAKLGSLFDVFWPAKGEETTWNRDPAVFTSHGHARIKFA